MASQAALRTQAEEAASPAVLRGHAYAAATAAAEGASRSVRHRTPEVRSLGEAEVGSRRDRRDLEVRNPSEAEEGGRKGPRTLEEAEASIRAGEPFPSACP